MTLQDLLDHVREYVAEQLPGQVPSALRIDLVGGGRIVHPISLGQSAARPTPTPSRAARRHSADYRSVHWDGEPYEFTPNQAAVIRQLWESWELDGMPDLGQARLLEGIDGGDVNAERLRDVFRPGGKQHKAWGVLIVPGTGKGTFRLDVSTVAPGASP
jgi:hypothetical protein